MSNKGNGEDATLIDRPTHSTLIRHVRARVIMPEHEIKRDNARTVSIARPRLRPVAQRAQHGPALAVPDERRLPGLPPLGDRAAREAGFLRGRPAEEQLPVAAVGVGEGAGAGEAVVAAHRVGRLAGVAFGGGVEWLHAGMLQARGGIVGGCGEGAA